MNFLVSYPDYSQGLVELRYNDGLGNNLFQYCFAKILAEELQCGLLINGEISGFNHAKSTVAPSSIDLYERKIEIEQIRTKNYLTVKENNDSQNVPFCELVSFIQQCKGTKFILVKNGYFQYLPFYTKYFTHIRNEWLKTEDSYDTEKINENDLTIHIRSGQGVWEKPIHDSYPSLPFSYYQRIIEQKNWGEIYIVTKSKDDPMVKKVSQHYCKKTIIISREEIKDFNFIKNSKNIILSVSTFGWFAAFLSQAKKIYYPLAGMFNSEIRPDIDIKVNKDNYLFQEIYPNGEFKEQFTGIYYPGKPQWKGTPEIQEFLLQH